MTVAGYFLRSRRRLTLLMEEPGVELGCKTILYGGGGLLLAAIPARGWPCPIGAALAAVSPGWWVLVAVLIPVRFLCIHQQQILSVDFLLE